MYQLKQYIKCKIQMALILNAAQAIYSFKSSITWRRLRLSNCGSWSQSRQKLRIGIKISLIYTGPNFSCSSLNDGCYGLERTTCLQFLYRCTSRCMSIVWTEFKEIGNKNIQTVFDMSDAYMSSNVLKCDEMNEWYFVDVQKEVRTDGEIRGREAEL